MQEPTFFILTALTEKPLHGYGIMQAVGVLSDGRLTLRAGTLYAALDRLREDGLLVVDREEAVDGRLRRYYQLTGDGAAALQAEVVRLRANASMAATKLRRSSHARLSPDGMGVTPNVA
ncbi:MAG TPA: PadR family transcriptional regulator [Micromonosporaceae bacterium]|nr:PadR family transcriptional regulator [Micromonosporaceae bacterium]HCU49780.1 PadR family transcriptional regulator [Micromonosporaceae bacterium]